MFNSYVKFPGNSGVLYKETQPSQSLKQYTLSLWMRPHQTPDYNMKVLTVKPSGFECVYSRQLEVRCFSDVASNNGGANELNANVDTLRLNNWYIVTLRSKSGYSSIQIREMNFDILIKESVKNSFFPGSSELNGQSFSQITLGIDDDQRSDGFIGNLRNFKVMNGYLDDQTIRKSQYTFLYPYSDMLLIQIILQDITDLQSVIWPSISQAVGQMNTLSTQVDYTGVFQCWSPTQSVISSQMHNLVQFSTQTPVSVQKLTSSLSMSSGTYLQAWIFRHQDTSSTVDQTLISHVGVLEVQFLKNSITNLTVKSTNRTTALTITATFPYQKWVFIQILNKVQSLQVSLYENNGTRFFNQEIFGKLTLTSQQQNFNFGQNYQGYILGIKYFKDTPPIQNPYPFLFEPDNNYFAIFYFMFTDQGYSKSSNTFSNLADASGQPDLELTSSNGQFVKDVFVRQYPGDTDITGMIPAQNNFDGVTCIDQKEKLFFQNSQSSASITFRSDQALSSYTFEFWFRPLQAIAGDQYLFSLQDSSIRSSPIQTLVMKVEKDNSLYCYPALSANPKQFVKYLDFLNTQINSWAHVSCIVDGNIQIQKGTLLNTKSNQNQAYFNDISVPTSIPGNIDLIAYLNVDPITKQKGANQIYYSEFKFWREARPVQSIQNQRFHQIDLLNYKGSNTLLSYSKLISASTQDSIPIDTDIISNSILKISNSVLWQTQSDIVFCPVGMFKSEARVNGGELEQVCYREGIINYQLIVYRDPVQGYIITSAYSKFRNQFVRDNFINLYNLKWTLGAMTEPSKILESNFRTNFTSQQTNPQIVIGYQNVTDLTSRYDLSLTITDKMNQQNPQSSLLKFKPNRCANIFDRVTMRSFVELDIETSKDVQDVIFKYDFTNCAGSYKLDQTAMVFSIDNDGITLSQGDHNPLDKSFSLRTFQQSMLPMNEYFYFKIKGVFKNPKDKTDTLEYSLIYACRFVQKLIITLSPNMLTVLKGQTLVIDHKATYTNMNMVSRDTSYSIKWTCPGALNEFCQTQTSDQLKISYDMVANAGLAFWRPQQITMTAQTNFIQGDGLKYSNRTVSIVWINVNADARLQQIGGIGRNFSKNANITLQLTVPGLREDQISIVWETSPAVGQNETCMPNGFNKKQLLLNPVCLVEGQLYNASVKLYYTSQNWLVWSGMIQALVPKSPFGGTLSCTPNAPKAFTDTVKCTATAWKLGAGTTFRYQFLTLSFGDSTPVAVSQIQSSNQFQGILPPSTTVQIRVIDVLDQSTYAQIALPVSILNQQATSDYFQKRVDIAKFTKTVKTLDLNQEFQLLGGSLKNISLFNMTLVKELSQSMSEILLFQALNFTSSLALDQRRFFTQGLLQLSQQLTQVSLKPSLNVLRNLQLSLNKVLNTDKAVLDSIFNDQNTTKMVFNLQSSIMQNVQSLWQSQVARTQDPGRMLQTNQSSSEVTLDSEEFQNVTDNFRQDLVEYEQYLSTKLGESEDFNLTTPTFNFTVRRFSRMSTDLTDAWFTDTSKKNGLSYTFPIKSAGRPSDRQSLSVITFKVNPYIGTKYLNQTATSSNAVYFAYRDDQGRYLDNTNVPQRINITFPYIYSPFIFLPNVSVCGYIGLQDMHWENQSCITTFKREQSLIECSCSHMSFYSIIDDQLQRPAKLPIIQLTFKNWASIITILYIMLIFIIGVIYTYNKDNQDYRYLHEQEELQGNELEFDEQISLVSLAFKRKVFFMNFSEKYTYWTLYHLYIMLVHPLFQLKYRMDPHISRFHRFLMLFTRINIAFGVSYFLLRNAPNPDSSQISLGEIIIFIVAAGSVLYLPVPAFMYSPFRSTYYLLKPKSSDNGGTVSDSEKAPKYIKTDPDDINIDYQVRDQFEDRLTNVEIDASIPINLLFIVNSLAIEKILNDTQGKYKYCTGDINAVGEKLLEIDSDFIKLKEEIPKKVETVTSHQGNSDRELVNRGPILSKLDIAQIHQQEDSGINLRSSPLKTKQHRPQGEQQDSPIPINDEENLENMNEGVEDDISARKFNHQTSKNQATQKKISRHLFEGGEREPYAEEVNESNVSLDTDLFINEKKEMLEYTNFFGRVIGGFLALAINGGIYVAVLYFFIKEGGYNLDNNYTWVVSFFGSQVFGLFIADPLCLMFLAGIVYKWLRFKKSFLARWFRESLYINEDYQFVVKFANTKIS